MTQRELLRLRQILSLSTLVLFTVIGGFLFGYDTGVVSGAMVLIADDLELSSAYEEMVVSATIAGALAGAGVSGWLSDRFGRRAAIIVSSLVFMAGAAAMALAPSISVLIVGRAIVGLGVGLASTVVPIYISECAPANFRGRLNVVNNVMVCVGQLCATLVDGAFASVPGGWRWMLGLSALPAALQLLGFAALLPRSPRWLLKRGRETEALHALMWLRGIPQRNTWLWALTRPCATQGKMSPVSEESQGKMDPSETAILAELRTMQRSVVDDAGGAPRAVAHTRGGGGGESEGIFSRSMGNVEDWDRVHSALAVAAEPVSGDYRVLNDGSAKAARRRGSTNGSPIERSHSLNGAMNELAYGEAPRSACGGCVSLLADGPRSLQLRSAARAVAPAAEVEPQCPHCPTLDVLLALARSPGPRRALILACSLQLLQQIAGINTVMYYFGSMMRSAGFDVSTSIWLACVPAAVQALCNVVALTFIEKCGRRVLTLISLAGVVVALVLLGASFFVARALSPELSGGAAEQMLCPGATSVWKTPPRCFDCVTTAGCGYCASYGVDGAPACLPAASAAGGALPAAGWNCSSSTSGGGGNGTRSGNSVGWNDTYCPGPAVVRYLPLIATILCVHDPGAHPDAWGIVRLPQRSECPRAADPADTLSPSPSHLI